MFQEPIESLPFLSADNAFPGDKTLEVSTVLPVLQLESFELGTIPAKMVRMAGTREFLIQAHPSAAPTKMPMSFEFLSITRSQSSRQRMLIYVIFEGRYQQPRRSLRPIQSQTPSGLLRDSRTIIAESQAYAAYL